MKKDQIKKEALFGINEKKQPEEQKIDNKEEIKNSLENRLQKFIGNFNNSIQNCIQRSVGGSLTNEKYKKLQEKKLLPFLLKEITMCLTESLKVLADIENEVNKLVEYPEKKRLRGQLEGMRKRVNNYIANPQFFIETEILSVIHPKIEASLITSSSVYGKKKQKKAWTSALVQCAETKKYFDILPVIEVALQSKKKKDVVDSGHRPEDLESITEVQLSITEVQLDEGRKDLDFSLLESQLQNSRPKEILESELPEGKLERREEAWNDNGIQLYKDVNNREKAKSKSNKSYYKKTKSNERIID